MIKPKNLGLQYDTKVKEDINGRIMSVNKYVDNLFDPTDISLVECFWYEYGEKHTKEFNDEKLIKVEG